MEQKPDEGHRIIRFTRADVAAWRRQIDDLPPGVNDILCQFADAVLFDLNAPPGTEPRVRRVNDAIEFRVPPKQP